MSLWTEDDGHVPNHYWPILLTLTSNNCLPHCRVKPVIWRQYPSLKGRISWHVADPTSREGWISFYWHVIVSLVVFEFEESWCTSDLCSFSNPRRKGWWEAFCPIQISQRCNCRVGDSKSGTSDKVTEQTATTNNPGISAGTIILLTEHNDDPGAKKKESEVSERCKESSWCVCSMVS